MHRRTLLKLTGATLAGALLPGRRAIARRVFPPDGGLDFKVLRHGKVIGAHRIRFSRDRGRFIVRSDVEAGRPGGSLFRFVHHAEEVWAGGWLHGVVSDTDDDGRLYRLRAKRRDGVFAGTVNGAAFTVSGYIIPSSLWHRDTPVSAALFDTVDGRVKAVRPHFIAHEQVRLAGKAVAAKHYRLLGEIRRDLWYDADCSLVRAAWLARDGSKITMEPRCDAPCPGDGKS